MKRYPFFLALCCLALFGVSSASYAEGGITNDDILSGGDLADVLPVDFTNEDLTEVNFSMEGAQPGSVVTVTLDVEDEDGSVNNYVYNVVADADGSITIPTVSAFRARSVVGSVDYMVMLREPQLTPEENMARNASVLPQVSVPCGFSTCLEDHPLSFENEGLPDAIAPYYNAFCGGFCYGYDRYPDDFYDMYPVVNQNFSFNWDRDAGGVVISGRGTPTSNIILSSSTDIGFSDNMDESVDLITEEISTLWPLWHDEIIGDPISHGGYEFPLMSHSEAGEGTTQFNAVVMNMTYNSGLGTFMPIEGNATSFNVDIDTGIEEVPETPGGDDGFPSEEDGDNATAAAAAAIAAGVIGWLMDDDSVEETYGQGPLRKMAEQYSINSMKEDEQSGTIADAEQQQKKLKTIEREKVEAIQETQSDELVCSVVTLSKTASIQSSFRTNMNRRIVREGLMSSTQRRRGSLGGMRARERMQWRIENVRANHCTPGGDNSAFSQFCQRPADSEGEALDHLDPNCLFGGETKDADASAGEVDDACANQLYLVSSASRPVPVPPTSQIQRLGSSEYEGQIADYYMPLVAHSQLVNDSFSSMHASTMKNEGTSVTEFRALLSELGFTDNEVNKYMPEDGSGISEEGQLEMVAKYMVANPNFFSRLQTNEANVMRVRALIRSISLSLDHQMVQLMGTKGRQLNGLNALLLRDDRALANTGLVKAVGD
ncbi:MAG: hypothetical protein ACPG05_00030 [Bdellovibrionales bacterium]